ncbi:hypothetical protein BTVI_58968 [Pitangus sulphuratus]|nr:hypothetical protein BTVI_58968 [Pitangus sulphuratus]
MVRLTCVMLLLSLGAPPVAEAYGLEITNNGPVTTGAQATVQATLSVKNENVTSDLYHFNWIYAPLILIEKFEQGFNSVINVTGEFPGTFPVSVWVTHRNCWLCRPVVRNVTVLQITEFITGNLTIAQIEDSEVVTRGSSFSTDAVTRISFSLHDPSHYFKSASFVYSWDFGDGPPLALCWLIKSECIPLEGDKCHLVEISGSCYNLSHTFRDAGQYCLSIRVENGVTMLQTYHGIKVWPTGIHPAFLVLLCITLVSVMLLLVLYTTFRSNTQQKDLVEVFSYSYFDCDSN